VQVAERKVLQLAFEVPDPEPVREGRKDVDRLEIAATATLITSLSSSS
jgi:hypothetical protein